MSSVVPQVYQYFLVGYTDPLYRKFSLIGAWEKERKERERERERERKRLIEREKWRKCFVLLRRWGLVCTDLKEAEGRKGKGWERGGRGRERERELRVNNKLAKTLMIERFSSSSWWRVSYKLQEPDGFLEAELGNWQEPNNSLNAGLRS